MRRLGKLGLLLVLGVVGPGILAGETPADEWSQFRGSYDHHGVSASAVPEDLRLLWSYDTGDVIDSSAAIADGRVYVGVGNGELIALDFATGEHLWTYATGSFIGESSPAVASGVVYIGDLDGVLHAVSAEDGTALWKFSAETEIKASPVVVDGVVLMPSYDSYLYAVEADTGALRWKVQTQGQVHATVAVRDGMAFVAGCDGVFRALRIEDGTEAYQIPIGSYTGSSPVLAGDRAYVGTYDAEVLAFDLPSHRVVWRYAHPERSFPFYSSGALTGDLFILGGRDKLVHAIDVETGQARWTFETRARVDSSPVVAGGRVYVGSSDERFYVLDVATGEKLWEFNTGAAITASPAIASGRVVISATDGVVYCFG